MGYLSAKIFSKPEPTKNNVHGASAFLSLVSNFVGGTTKKASYAGLLVSLSTCIMFHNSVNLEKPIAVGY
jgi:hypothetical protein